MIENAIKYTDKEIKYLKKEGKNEGENEKLGKTEKFSVSVHKRFHKREP